MRNKVFWILVLTLLLSLTIVPVAWAEEELDSGKYYTMVDEKGKVIDYTGLKVSVGDEYISPDNNRYRVEKVAGLTAYTKNMGKVSLATEPINYSFAGFNTSYGFKWMAAKGKPVVGIYSTHTDESYTPSDGADSIRGKGGIIKVADALTKGLAGRGVKAIHDPAKHDPHDPHAYNRSRKTASRLMRKGALALIDVHRDAAPAKAYATKVQGKDVTRIKLVVGRSNPKMAANMDFAKRMKAHIDKDHPGLSAGIFIGHGNYNQDLTPHSMLIEVGADKNDRGEAQRAVSLFATSVPEALGVKSTKAEYTDGVKGTLTSANSDRGGSRTSYVTTIGILIVLALVGGAFYMMNRRKVK